MEDDDDFGDLYTDSLHLSPASQKPLAVAPAAVACDGGCVDADEEDDNILHGSSLPVAPLPESLYIDRERQVSAEDADDDWLLGRDPPPVEEPANWVDDDEEVVLDRVPSGAVGGLRSKGGEARVLEKDEAEAATRISKEEGNAPDGEGFLEKTPKIEDPDDEPAIPGLLAAVVTSELPNDGLVKASESDDWDSGSEDDLQIVLNDTGHDLLGAERRDGGGSDEDDEDLVIVTDDDQRHHHQAVEEQNWGDDAMLCTADGEKKEMLDGAKASCIAPTASGGGIGYSNHGFHSQHHSMFKYVRPGATPAPRGLGMVAAGALGQVRPPVFGLLAGRGRGDWRPVGSSSFPNMQKGFHSGYGLPTWANSASGRLFGSGLDFILPSHKTVFDIDIESFEEKPWRHPGVDISDFFNFELDEEHWKEYCKQVEQLRLESTMQSKIRVYESGRSEQDYDPDLPPELAAAAGLNNMSANNNLNHGKSENLPADLSEQGTGSACMRPVLPTGRAIQVESGYGERLPSIDTRPPRIRDSDAVIEIVLQDNLDDSKNSNGAFKQHDNSFGRENKKVFHDVDEEDMPAESEFYGRFPRSSTKQMESMDRRIPISSEGDGILPFPSESSRQYNSSPKSRSPIDTARSFGAQHGGRLSQRTSHRKNSSERSSETPPIQNAHLDKHEGHHHERPNDAMEGNHTPESPPSNIVEITMEGKLTLGDSQEGDGGEASDIRISSEPVSDDGLMNSASRQKSCVDQSGAQDNGVGDDSRLTHSDNSRARSENSRDYQKSHEICEEVMQVHPLKQAGDPRKNPEEDDRRRRDDYGRDGRRETGRNRSRDSSSGQTIRGRGEGFERVMDDSVGAWHRREDDTHNRVYNEEIRHREGSKARMTDRKKRLDDGDWRGHSRDDGLRHRGRNDILMNRRENIEDSQMKRKRDAELARRERADREDSRPRKRVRDDDIVDHRKREETEDRHSSKHKDASWYQRDREDRQQLHGREERRFTSRSGRHTEEKTLAGSGKNKEDLKVTGSDKEYRDNDRRRRRNDLSKRDDRPSGASDEHQVEKGRHREMNRKVKDSEPVGQKREVSGKRKRGVHSTHRSEINSKGSSEQKSPNRCTTEGKKVHVNAEQMEGSLLPSARHGDEDPGSDEENHDSRRGRSKLERWTGHKERGYSNIQPSSIVREVEDSQDEVNELATNAEEQDRHLDTVAKLKMRSERFKLPMPGEKDKDLTGNKKVESEAPSACIQNETAASTAACDVDVKLERPARKRKWTGS